MNLYYAGIFFKTGIKILPGMENCVIGKTCRFIQWWDKHLPQRQSQAPNQFSTIALCYDY